MSCEYGYYPETHLATEKQAQEMLAAYYVGELDLPPEMLKIVIHTAGAIESTESA